jgi:hypothetical protein
VSFTVSLGDTFDLGFGHAQNPTFQTQMSTSADATNPAIRDLYARHPALKATDDHLRRRLAGRRWITSFIPKNARGAELGVFTGLYSELLIQETQPSTFYMVDPWWKLFGDKFPDYGPFSAYGELETKVAWRAACARAGAGKVIVDYAVNWLRTLDHHLDWAYLDSSHVYDKTLAELIELDRRLAPDGVILGDDGWASPEYGHYGVFRAVRDFCRLRFYEVINLDNAGQWAIRRSKD